MMDTSDSMMPEYWALQQQNSFKIQASFHHDFQATLFGHNRVLEVLSQALEECQRRFMNPFQRFSLSKVSWTKHVN